MKKTIVKKTVLLLITIFVMVAEDSAQGTATAASDKLQSSSEIERELKQLEWDWSSAYLKHDVTTLDRILANDYVGIDGRAFISNKEQELEDAKAPRPGDPAPAFQVLDETITDMKVRPYGDVVIVTGRSIEKVKFNGKNAEVQYRRTTVWVKREGRWQCVSFHASRIVR